MLWFDGDQQTIPGQILPPTGSLEVQSIDSRGSISEYHPRPLERMMIAEGEVIRWFDRSGRAHTVRGNGKLVVRRIVEGGLELQVCR